LDSNIAHRTSDFEFFSKLLGQIERQNRRIDEAVERWLSERRALQSEIEEWRGKLAEMSGKLLAAETLRTRHVSTIMRLRRCLEWLDQKGGLGLEVHERIKQTLDEVPRVSFVHQRIDPDGQEATRRSGGLSTGGNARKRSGGNV
jgi:chromosome segregation ATPase